MDGPDVIVAGAGPVGMLLGCLLAARGVDVLICERREGPDERSRAIGLHPPGLAALSDAGVGENVRAEALALERGEVHAGGRMLASVRFGGDRCVLTLPQHRTDALLRARLAELSCPVVERSRVLSVRQTAERVLVRISGPAGEQEVTARFLVAADGVRSPMREALGIGWRTVGRRARYVMADIPAGDQDAVARLHCEPSGLVESFPLPDGRRRWVLRRTDSDDLLEPDGFAAAVRERTGERIEVPDGIRPSGFVAAQHRAVRTVQGRVVLLGDAAHEISPIGGQGMNLGWSDARRLCGELIRALRTGGADFAGYERATARAAADAQRRSAFYMAMGRPASLAGQAGREALIRLMGSAPLRERTAALVTMAGL